MPQILLRLLVTYYKMRFFPRGHDGQKVCFNINTILTPKNISSTVLQIRTFRRWRITDESKKGLIEPMTFPRTERMLTTKLWETSLAYRVYCLITRWLYDWYLVGAPLGFAFLCASQTMKGILPHSHILIGSRLLESVVHMHRTVTTRGLQIWPIVIEIFIFVFVRL